MEWLRFKYSYYDSKRLEHFGYDSEKFKDFDYYKYFTQRFEELKDKSVMVCSNYSEDETDKWFTIWHVDNIEDFIKLEDDINNYIDSLGGAHLFLPYLLKDVRFITEDFFKHKSRNHKSKK